MKKVLYEKVFAQFDLTPDQRLAAAERGRDVVVTAGAGSGKTSTLVARYASLLADGIDMRRVIAVTFTEKAAREMRFRVRDTLNKLVSMAKDDEERQFWVELNSRMDGARISTIHSLCAEMLRAHPAEAVVDPRFEVQEESLTAALRAQIVEDAMSRMVGMDEFTPLFHDFEIRDLSNLLQYLLDRRLETQEAFESKNNVRESICRGITSLMDSSEISEPLLALQRMSQDALDMDAGEKLAGQVKELLSLWARADCALSSGDYLECARLLYQIRVEKMDLRSGKRDSEVKSILKDLQIAFDNLLSPISGGKPKNNLPPDDDTETTFFANLQLLRSAFDLMVDSYREALRQTGELDFDDLEAGAARLLRDPALQELWQTQVDALLVDEFQDTNQRQRDIVEALAGNAGKLFIVGDAKQSIYRFRRADVTVFRAIRQSIRNRGGLPIDLNITFRAHEALLSAMNDILKVVMGEIEDPSRPYYEPFAALLPFHENPREGIASPHMEFVIGYGEEADTARPAAARALAARLLELKDQGQIKDWDDVTLLFRAATGFPHYEAAFEEANIPFVTVAGRGFYDRAEVRDVLNIMRALADPSDDLSMAGLMRSPAFGLTDAAVYQLRWKNGKAVDYWSALRGDLSMLTPEDQERVNRLVAILEKLLPKVDRIPVAELLRLLVIETDYRAMLAIEGQNGGGGRLWRNLDKLIEDAQASGKVNVRDFLDYLRTIDEVGAREGEAPAEALGSVRLMTIHKAKGLQFPFVVLADASRRPRGRSEGAYLLPEIGLAFKADPEPMLYRLAKVLEKRQSEAEEKRILYVALTRAQQKLIINGHLTASEKQGWTTAAWMKELVEAIPLDLNDLVDLAGEALTAFTSSRQPLRAWAPLPEGEVKKSSESFRLEVPQETDKNPIYGFFAVPSGIVVDEDEIDEIRDWRVTGKEAVVPPTVIGKMVHKAIEHWILPDDPRLPSTLHTSALNAGLALRTQQEAAIGEAKELLSRLARHPIRAEIEAAAEIFHEVPYSRMVADHAETGYIDLLYCDDTGWQVVDFKTDTIYSDEHRASLVVEYGVQMRRYASAIEVLLGESVRVRICFLDDQGKVWLVEV